MKMVSFLAAALFAVSAFGTTSVSTGYREVLGNIALDNACITATEVRTVKPVDVCAKLVPVTRQDEGSSYTEWICQQWTKSHVANSRSFERTTCLEYVTEGEGNMFCSKWGTVADFMPATIPVTVVTQYGEADDFPGKTYLHTFPACK
jgi:hypothetical protein